MKFPRSIPFRRLVQLAALSLYFYLFFYVSWPYAPVFTSRIIADKTWMPVETFLWVDPLVGLSTAVAARGWNVALIGLIVILSLGLVLPRLFCGYLCPLGTLLDGFDVLVGRLFPSVRPRKFERGLHLRYYLLAAVLAGAWFGVLLSGFVAAIPVLTRGLLFTGGQLQLGWLKNWSMVPPASPAIYFSFGLFTGIFLVSWITPRFWCRYVCPSGALLSVPALLGLSRRHINEQCAHCGQCRNVCPFDAIQPDYRTRNGQCAFCQTCADACPHQAISFTFVGFGGASSREALCPPKDQTITLSSVPTHALSRRTLFLSGLGGAVAALVTRLLSAPPGRPLRPPGSQAEERFLDLCIRCEQCLKVCPGPVLQAAGWEYGWESLWTPVPVFTHAGCHPECNFCTQVCPTGAIRPLPLPEKRRTPMGVAVIDSRLCLPLRGERDCQLCFEECNAAGYRAIEMRTIPLPLGAIPAGAFSPAEIEEMGRIQAPFIRSDACVGCGLCEYRCHSALVSQRQLLSHRAITVRPSQMKKEET